VSRKPQKKRRSFIGWLFNQLILLGLFYLFVQWWQRSQEEEARQQSRQRGQEEDIQLAHYEPGEARGVESAEAPQQPQTQPVDSPGAAGPEPSQVGCLPGRGGTG
jgi:hypothetical protein